MTESYTVTSWVIEVRKAGTKWATWSLIGPGDLPGEKAWEAFPAT